MDTLIHADVFFFITTIAVVVVATALTIALIYLAKVLSDLKKITEQVRDETVLFRGDLSDLRSNIKQEGFKLYQLADFATGLFQRKKPSRSKKK
jgi:hypothetical protein